MAEDTPQSFNHFSLISFTDRYWMQAPDERRQVRRRWLDALKQSSDVVHVYQAFGPEAQNDLLLWCAVSGDDVGIAQRFFAGYAEAMAPARPYCSVEETLWGFTRPSQYTKTRSAQEIDPFSPDRLPYLIMYPFVKTVDWYLKDRDERQRMMAQHIKVGKQYKDITQLLLYSTGLQDQEFVVVYETHDLVRFQSLVTQLRGTEARVHTQRDYPLHAAIFQADADTLDRWL